MTPPVGILTFDLTVPKPNAILFVYYLF